MVLEKNGVFISKLSEENVNLKVYIPNSVRELVGLKKGQKVKIVIERVV